MSSAAGFGGKPQQTTKPSKSSRLRNEVHAESLDDDHGSDGSSVVLETQFDEASPRSSTGGGENGPLSPGSQSVLTQCTNIKPRKEARDSPPIIFGISRKNGPNLSPDIRPFAFIKPPSVARKLASKPVETVEVVDSQASVVSAPTPTPPQPVTDAAIQDRISVDEQLQASPVQDQEDLHVEQLPQEQHVNGADTPSPCTILEPQKRISVPPLESRGVAEQAMVAEAQTDFIETASKPYPEEAPPRFNPRFRMDPNGRMIRRVKRRDKKSSKDSSLVGPQQSSVLDLGIGKLCPQSSEMKPSITTAIPEHSESTGRVHNERNKFDNTHAQPLPAHDQRNQPLPDALEFAFTQAPRQDVRPQAPESAYPNADPPPSTPKGNRSNSRQMDYNSHRSGGERPRYSESLHKTSSMGGSNRVLKPKQRDAHPISPRSRQKSYSGTSAQGAHLADCFEQAYLAGKSSGHEILAEAVKAYEVALVSLRQTNKCQQDVIEGLQEEKTKLHEDYNKHEGKFTNDVQRLNGITARMQKFVKGVDSDFTTLKQQAKTHHDENDSVLRLKIDELKSEKKSLLEDLSSTLETVGKSRRNMKAVLDDCYVRLMISESKRTNLVQNLKEQTKLYEEEKERRTEIEQQTKPVLQSMLRTMKDHHAALCGKVESLQTSVDDTTVLEEHGSALSQCVDVLKALQEAPSLMIEDLERVEGRIRHMHKGMEGKLDRFVGSVQSLQPSTAQLEEVIHEVQALETKVLKFNEAIADCQKAQHENDLLRQQIAAQVGQCSKLEEEVGIHRQAESDLRSRYSQLEHELGDLRNTARDQEAEPPELEQELLRMRQQIRKVEDDLQSKTMELGSANERLREQADQVARAERLEEVQKQKIIDQSREIYEIKKHKARTVTAELRNVEEQYQKAIKEKEVTLNNEIRRLTFERDEKNDALNAKETERRTTKDSLDEANNKLRTLELEITGLQEVNAQTLEKLEKANPTTSEKSELSELRQQLLHKTNALHMAEQEADTLRKEADDLKDRATACQDERDTLRVQLSEKEAEIEALQTQADLRVEYERSTLQELRNQVESLHNSNVSLTESLEQFRRNEKRSDEARQGYLEERSSLLSQLNDAQNALEAQETEIQRIQDRRKEELDDAEEIHKTEVNELQHRVAQVEKEKDKAKADAARTEAEKDGLIEGLKKKCEEKFESLVEQEVQKRLEQIEQATVKAGEHSSRLVQQSGPIPGNIPSALSNAQNGKVRKPITRRNASVMGITGVSQELESLEIFPWNISGRQHNEYVEDPDREDLGTGEFHNEVVDPSAEVVPETQLTMTTGQFTARFNQVSGPSRSHSSSSLSDWPGDELLDMDDNTGSGGDGMQGNPSHSPLKDGSSDNGVDMHSRGSSRNSRLNHPKSQANMSVRMMGPPSIPGSSKEYVPGNHRHSSQFANVESGSTSRVDRSTKGGSSSPAFMHATGSSSKTYGQHAGIATGSLGHQRSSTPQAQSYGSSQKRKGSHFHNESGPSKRHQSRSPSLPRSRHEDLPGPATRSTRNRSEAGSRDASQSGYSPRVPSAQGLVTHSSRRSSAGRNPSHRGPSKAQKAQKDMRELNAREMLGSQRGRGRRH